MRWLWIADINLNEPANLFQLLGQPHGDRARLTVVFICLVASLSVRMLPIGLSVFLYSFIINLC